MRLLTNPKLRKICLQITAFVGLGIWMIGMPGCVTPTPPPPLPQSAWGEKYAFSYQLPAGEEVKPPNSVPVTIAVVNPSYKVTESILWTQLYRHVGAGFSASMGSDLDKILIAKGLTTTGPYPSLDEITYSQKKDAALTLAPEVFITAEIKNINEPRQIGYNVGMPNGQANARSDQDFAMSVTGWISFIMEEPLSGEKMWIKKLELDPVSVQGVVVTEMIPQVGPDQCGDQVVNGYRPGKILYDGRPDAMADALKKMYPVIMAQFDKYIDPAELVQLKQQSKEIRASKVY